MEIGLSPSLQLGCTLMPSLPARDSTASVAVISDCLVSKGHRRFAPRNPSQVGPCKLVAAGILYDRYCVTGGECLPQCVVKLFIGKSPACIFHLRSLRTSVLFRLVGSWIAFVIHYLILSEDRGFQFNEEPPPARLVRFARHAPACRSSPQWHRPHRYRRRSEARLASR
jgi:hypothetical protein